MYDAIIVGSRCAGAATALELARRGRRVLAVDRAKLTSGHVPPAGNIVAPGVWYLQRWGLLDELVDAGCPPVRSMAVNVGGERVEHAIDELGGVDAFYVADHAVLGSILARAAVAAGADVLEQIRVTGLVREGGRVVGVRGTDADGNSVEERAAIVIGADGRTSRVASDVGARIYRARPAGQCAYHAFWADTGHHAIEMFVAPDRATIVFPTHHGQAWIIAARPVSEWQAYKANAAEEYQQQIEMFPGLAAAMAGATRVSRLYGTATLDGFFRQASGPGWALVGDAGHTKDPAPGRGVSDAFIQADLLAEAVNNSLASGDWDGEMSAYGRRRDELMGEIYDLTHDLAPHPPLEEAGALSARLAEAAARQHAWVIANRGGTLER